MENSKISWTHHTSPVKLFASLQLSLIADAIRLVVLQLVTDMTESKTVANVES